MKLLKRLLLAVAILLVGAVVAASVGYYMLKRRPSFYHSYKWTGDQRSVVNQRAVDKLTLTRNFAADEAGQERRGRGERKQQSPRRQTESGEVWANGGQRRPGGTI